MVSTYKKLERVVVSHLQELRLTLEQEMNSNENTENLV